MDKETIAEILSELRQAVDTLTGPNKVNPWSDPGQEALSKLERFKELDELLSSELDA